MLERLLVQMECHEEERGHAARRLQRRVAR
jgi:hypothetical protein